MAYAFAKSQAKKSVVVMKLNRNGKSNIHYIFCVFIKDALLFELFEVRKKTENTISILFFDMNRTEGEKT